MQMFKRQYNERGVSLERGESQLTATSSPPLRVSRFTASDASALAARSAPSSGDSLVVSDQHHECKGHQQTSTLPPISRKRVIMTAARARWLRDSAIFMRHALPSCHATPRLRARRVVSNPTLAPASTLCLSLLHHMSTGSRHFLALSTRADIDAYA